MRIYKEMDAYAQTHIGFVRKKNEDRHMIKKLDDGSMLLFVADGLGGEVAGDLAAEMILQKLKTIDEIEVGNEIISLGNIACELDMAVSKHSETDSELGGLGSTLVCILIRDKQVYWVHVGDSRLYHFHQGGLDQITQDQTLARFLLEEGEITPEEYPCHYSQRIMDQCIGCGYSEPETGHFKINTKDKIMLASDGLHRYVDDQTIKSILQLNDPIKTKVNQLVESSLIAGGKDNVTVVLIEIE